MGRKPQINIVNVFTWFSNVLDIHELDNSETVVMIHLIKILNRNFWKPIKMSTHKLAKNLGKKNDSTIKDALQRLKKKQLIIESEEGEIYIGIAGAERYFQKRTPKPEPEPERIDTAQNSTADVDIGKHGDDTKDNETENLEDLF